MNIFRITFYEILRFLQLFRKFSHSYVIYQFNFEFLWWNLFQILKNVMIKNKLKICIPIFLNLYLPKKIISFKLLFYIKNHLSVNKSYAYIVEWYFINSTTKIIFSFSKNIYTKELRDNGINCISCSENLFNCYTKVKRNRMNNFKYRRKSWINEKHISEKCISEKHIFLFNFS